MSILIFQHQAHENPGRLGATLRDHGFRLDVRNVGSEGRAALPPDLDGVHGIVSMGGPQMVDQNLDWMGPEMALIREAHARQLPVIGVCLGAQLIATALGGRVTPMTAPDGKPRAEWGFAPVNLNSAGQTETLLSGVPWSATQFHAHEQEVSQLPPDATLLASSALCKVQAFKAGVRTFAFQFHFECDRPMLQQFLHECASCIARAGARPEDLARQADINYERYARVSERLCLNLVTYLFPLARRLAV
jgi:GMP synthase (glutamine-hydrolysing)